MVFYRTKARKGGAQKFCFFFKEQAVFFGPPVGKRAVGGKFTTHIVEAVRKLMANDHADASVIDSVFKFFVKKRRLHDACRKSNFVEQRMVVSIDHMGRHAPFFLINWFTEFSEVFGDTKTTHFTVIEGIAIREKTQA